METKDSPVYWQKPHNTAAHIRLNDYLVLMFERLLQVTPLSPLPPVAETSKELASDLPKLVKRSS